MNGAKKEFLSIEQYTYFIVCLPRKNAQVTPVYKESSHELGYKLRYNIISFAEHSIKSGIVNVGCVK